MAGAPGRKVWIRTLPSGRLRPALPGHLHEQAECPLCGPEIGKLQAGVRVHDAHQLDPREVQTLGDHLGADQHVDLAVAEIIQRLSQYLLLPNGVRVDPPHDDGRELALQLFLDPFRPETRIPHVE